MSSLIERQLDSILSPEWGGRHTGSRRSELLDYLPAMYAGDDFLNRFLCIFEDTLKPLQMQADNLHYYFHPLTTPAELVEWMATWVYLVLDDSWSIKQRRQLIHSAPELYSRRGTRRGLAEYIKLYTGVEPEISEYVDGMVLGPDTFLGENTTIAGRERHSFTVTLHLQGLGEEELVYKEGTIRRIIESEKPAHTAYRLRILTGPNGNGNGSPRGRTYDAVDHTPGGATGKNEDGLGDVDQRLSDESTPVQVEQKVETDNPAPVITPSAVRPPTAATRPVKATRPGPAASQAEDPAESPALAALDDVPTRLNNDEPKQRSKPIKPSPPELPATDQTGPNPPGNPAQG